MAFDRFRARVQNVAQGGEDQLPAAQDWREQFGIDRPRDREQLYAAIVDLTGLHLSRVAVCDGHTAPFEAVAEAFFAEEPVTVWKASRNLGGKTTALAALGYVEAVTLGTGTSILGGSGLQSERALEALTGYWERPGAPRGLLYGDPSTRSVNLRNGARIKALAASSKSVRGPHPERLRCDEVDEMEWKILTAALGQPVSRGDLLSQTVLASTHQYPAGTMTKTMREAALKGWPIRQWCYRENLEPHGWLTAANILRTKTQVTEADWNTEFELQEPDPGALAFLRDRLEVMFDPELGNVPGELAVEYRFEGPERPALYAHGADWAKERDKTVLVTLRIDCNPWRLVAYCQVNREPWPVMIGRFNDRVAAYGGYALHDGTGIGDVIDDLLTVNAPAVWLSGRRRSETLNEYIKATEAERIKSPWIDHAYAEHRYATRADLFGTDKKENHLPDSVCALALAVRAAVYGGTAHEETQAVDPEFSDISPV